MTQAQFEKLLANELEWTRKEVVDLMDIMGNLLHDGLKSEGVVIIRHFGRFKIVDRPARMGRNPATGEKIKIKASKRLRVLPNKAMRDRLKVK